jgi:hypothetical protein
MKKAILLAFTAIVLFSCKKDNDDDCSLNADSLAGTYKITAMLYKAPGVPEQDVYEDFFSEPCQRDDNYVFNASGTFVFNDAGVECSPPEDFNGTWSLSGSVITIDGESATISEFDCNSFETSVSDFATTGDKLTIVFTRL